MKHKLVVIIGILVGCLVALLLILVVYQNIALSQTRKQFPPPGRLVSVDGHSMHINCAGNGSPSVIIDAGNASFSLEWTPILQALSASTRICTYDRAGYGWSEPGPNPRDGARVVLELYTLLQNAGEAGPFILVGHSLGGVHMRMFAAQYPEQVAGMVLVDTPSSLEITTEYEMQQRSTIGFYQVMGLLSSSGVLRLLGPLGGEDAIPVTARKLPVEMQEKYLEMLLNHRQYATAVSEMEQIPKTFEQANQLETAVQPLPDWPIIVLTAGKTDVTSSNPFKDQTMAIDADMIAAQHLLTRLSSRAEQRVIQESGHLMHLDAPQAVVEAVLDVINTIRNEKRSD
jgi:pimeloyl-ACP methyl ester carboxylesterase